MVFRLSIHVRCRHSTAQTLKFFPSKAIKFIYVQYKFIYCASLINKEIFELLVAIDYIVIEIEGTVVRCVSDCDLQVNCYVTQVLG